MTSSFFRALPILAVLFVVSVAAQGETLTFDGITVNGTTNPSSVAVPDGYGGLNFTNFDLLNTTENATFNTSFPVSYPEVIYNSYGESAGFAASSGTFTLDSFYINGKDASDTVTMSFSTYFSSNGVTTESGGQFVLDVSSSAATLETFDIPNVTDITFSTPDGEYFAIDNLTVSGLATPEPSSLVLLGTGMLSLAGAVRRRFRQA